MNTSKATALCSVSSKECQRHSRSSAGAVRPKSFSCMRSCVSAIMAVKCSSAVVAQSMRMGPRERAKAIRLRMRDSISATG